MCALRNGTLGKRDYEDLARFRQALRRFAAFSEQAARKAGLTPQQHQVLLAIKGAPGREMLTVGDIALALLIRPHSAGELIDRLAHLGLVQRRSDPDDHRRVQVELTPGAEATLEDLSAAHLDELRRIRPALADMLRKFESAESDA